MPGSNLSSRRPGYLYPVHSQRTRPSARSALAQKFLVSVYLTNSLPEISIYSRKPPPLSQTLWRELRVFPRTCYCIPVLSGLNILRIEQVHLEAPVAVPK